MSVDDGADCRCSVNIGNALTLRLPEDLHLKGDQRNVALTIFFVPYVLFEIPSNILMKRSKPHIWRMSIRWSFLSKTSANIDNQ